MIPEEVYRARATRFGLEGEKLSRQFGQVANIRLAVFALAAALAGVAVWRRLPWLAGPAGLPLIGFAVLVWYHARLRRARDRAHLRQRLASEGLRRLAQDSEALPRRHTLEPDPEHPYALDLDIVGRASLLHLADTTTSPMGAATLAGWLLQPAAPEHLRERQAAVADLAPRLDAREELAGLAHDEPSWAVPDIDPEATSIVGAAVGHPLLPSGRRVDNDVTVGPAGWFLLVTGSNMSGKSTLLGSIGVNAVLAAAGGPVCARALRLPPLRLWTSMRIADSLEHGVSYFLAEVRRLKQIVEVARTGDGGPPVCYLLDEMLQGTNTAERQIAARSVLRPSRPAPQWAPSPPTTWRWRTPPI